MGWCPGPSDLALLDTTLGLDFIELPVAKALMGTTDDFEQLVAQLHRSRLIARAANVLLPATLKVVGPETRPDELSDYASTAFDRACRLGISVLVFGSGASRFVPAGYSRERALKQFEDAVRIVGEQASARGLTLAVEPLNSRETNLLNSVGEAAEFLRHRSLDVVRLVADLWPMECEGEQLGVLDDLAHVIAHSPLS